MLRVVLDTNIFIGVLLDSRNCRTIRNAFLKGLFDILISNDLFEELLETCRKPRLSRVFKPEDIRELLDLLKIDAEWVAPRAKIVIARDPDDNIVLECAADGKADCIVTGDDDLLCLKVFRNIPILTPREFLNHLETEKSSR